MKLRFSTAATFTAIFALIIKSHLNIFVALAYIGTFLILIGALSYNTETHDH